MGCLVKLTKTPNGLVHEDGRPIHSPLRKIRMLRGLSQGTVAEAVQLDKGSYSRIERGVGQTHQTARRIALYFGREVTELQILYPEDYITSEELKS